MQLEDYFDFLAPTDIRVKGTRIALDTILDDYLELGSTAEEIALRYRSLSLEQVYATLAYYWRNREQMDAYLRAVDQEMERLRQEQERNPPPALLRLREMLKQREAEKERQVSLAKP